MTKINTDFSFGTDTEYTIIPQDSVSNEVENEDIEDLIYKIKIEEILDDSQKIYFHEVSRYPLLTRDEEIHLSELIANGDAEAKNKLINCNLRLVVYFAFKYQMPGVDLMDLIQAGNMGLIRATEKYDASRGCRFCTYASNWIKQGITKAIRNQRRIIRLPDNVCNSIGKMERIAKRLSKEGFEATSKEIAEEMGVSVEKVNLLRQISQGTKSIEEMIGEKEGETLEKVIAGQTMDDFYDELDRAMLRAELEDIFKVLTDCERDVMIASFDLTIGNHFKTEDEVREEYSLTKKEIRSVREMAIRKLRKPVVRRRLSAFAG